MFMFFGLRFQYIELKSVYTIDAKEMDDVYKACIISTGTELLLGSTIDSNAVFLSQKLTEMGFRIMARYTVGDNKEQIAKAFKDALEQADLVISSGGLGPTLDDLTKEIACEISGCKMELVEEEVNRLKDFFARRKHNMPKSNLKQAMFPPEAVILRNIHGTAPGMYLNKNGKILVLLPGPPRELQVMYLKEVEPRLSKDYVIGEKHVARKTIKVIGPGESQVDEMLADVIDNSSGCSLAFLAKDGEIHIKITAEGEDLKHSEAKLNEVSSRIEAIMDKYVFGYDDETLVGAVAELMITKGKTLSLAESCTGGMLAKMITDLAGSSKYFWGSVASYSNEAKIKLLGVTQEKLNEFGAVSKEIAEEMAKKIITRSNTDYSLAITGIAGPEGGTPNKPVGLVYIALADKDGCEVKEMHFAGAREAIRILASKTALDMLRRRLK
ncbi:MAG: competence/damage-inducible protein A [Syntrophomonadaceae bacterium]|jgi:nicotinamide-nucleotide amidase